MLIEIKCVTNFSSSSTAGIENRESTVQGRIFSGSTCGRKEKSMRAFPTNCSLEKYYVTIPEREQKREKLRKIMSGWQK